MTIDQWHAKVERMTVKELKAHIGAFDTQLANMDTHGQPWPKILQQKRDCLAALAVLEATDAETQLSFPFSGDA